MTDQAPRDRTADEPVRAGAQPSPEFGRAVEGGAKSERAGCFLCGRTFRASHAEPVDAGGGVELCVGCGALYRLPGCC